MRLDPQLHAIVGDHGSLQVDQEDEVVWKLAMLIEGECEGLGPSKAAEKFGFSKQRYFQLRHVYQQHGAQALASRMRGPKRNYRRTDEVVRQVIRHRFLDADASAEVIAGKLRQTGLAISTRSVERVIADYGLQKILFTYPRGRSERSSAPGYVQPQVRLEIGARSDHWPVLDGKVEPYAATEFPKVFTVQQVTVRTLASERTFWEKVTLLHAEHHRPAAKPIGDRLSRHYYDVAQLCRGDIGQRAVNQVDLLESVVRHKSLFFRSGWANYQAAVPGSIRLLPKEGRLAELKRDYESMAEMIFTEPPPLDSILCVIGDLEERINKR